ncbi:hypothetical protein PIIN_05775 [Serendipita indica DSM 11827]|uniref:NAD(P)-binding domain-containing protein n=1 Tax=Serendipita indica (strain DSM 11827) TaxID=1109443 RepID=G4TKJ0_SERID|nr:hypothetical protein PIIN_05775 [Serendipita indica DSM 11827]
MPSAALFGATGATGKHILKELLSNKEITKVGEYGRRVTALDSLKDVDTSKLHQKVVDFEKIEEDQDLKQGWDIVYIALGTTRAAAGSAAAFEKIDREHVLAAARATKTTGTQRLVYISSVGANRNSMFLYSRSKGLTEDGLSALGYSDTIIFRPGFLKGRDTKQAFMANALDGFMSILPGYKNHMQIHVADLGKAVVTAGLLGTAGLPKAAQATEQPANGHKFTLIGNVGALGLASLSSA